MSTRRSMKSYWIFSVLLLVTAAPLAQDRLVINVSKAKRPQSSTQVIHYQGTGSVRHSDERTYTAAQERRSTEVARSRSEGREAQTRRTTGSQARSESQAEARTSSGATQRHGSVRLDTIR